MFYVGLFKKCWIYTKSKLKITKKTLKTVYFDEKWWFYCENIKKWSSYWVNEMKQTIVKPWKKWSEKWGFVSF